MALIKRMIDDIINNESSFDNSTYDNSDSKNIIEKYPYESSYYIFDSTYKHKQIYLDNKGMIMDFFTGKLSDNSELYIYGYITNPMYLKGNMYMDIKYYDRNYNEIGTCKDTIELLGEGYSNNSFSCYILEQELVNNKGCDDVFYYKINISSLEIEN